MLEVIKADINTGKTAKEAVLPALQLQSSVRERIPVLPDFYQKIFEITGVPNSIIDYACGLNPSHDHMDIGQGYEFSCHNTDTPAQQLTLLAGLAALHDLVRKDMAATKTT